MKDSFQVADRVVIGGGLFGAYAAILLADRGHRVTILEQDRDLLTRASFVNQARLHSGLHYPRSFLTAKEALSRYHEFRNRFPAAVRDFTQIYAVATHNSKTSGTDFAAFISRLEQTVVEIDPNKWFHRGTVSRSFQVSEPSFDAVQLRRLIKEEIEARPRIRVLLNTGVTGGKLQGDRVLLRLSNHQSIWADGLVIAAYASTNAVRLALGLSPLPLTFELAEVVLGSVSSDLQNHGFTVMDGPFWSMMPFGHTNSVSLTSVGLTPLRTSADKPMFFCQTQRTGCTPLQLANCNSCSVQPPSAATHQYQQMAKFLKSASSFSPTGRLLTVKAVLTDSEVDDSRPTLIRKEPDSNVYTVFSGKISTLFDLDKELQ